VDLFITSSTTTRFLLARHGETQWNQQKKLQGQLDSPLTQSGISQASSLGHSLAQANIELIISSPLPRALLTADIIQQHLFCPLLEESALIERHFGDWQGKLIRDIEHSLEFKATFNEVFFEVTAQKPPNGESALASSKRLQRALVDIAHNTSKTKILIVSHGDILRSFLSLNVALNFNQPSQHYVNGCVFVIDYHHHSGQFEMIEPIAKPVVSYD